MVLCKPPLKFIDIQKYAKTTDYTRLDSLFASWLLILLLLLAMYQIDRQWMKLTEMETAMSEQSKDMRELRSALPPRSIGQACFKFRCKREVAQSFKRPMQLLVFLTMHQVIGVWMPSAPI